MKNNAMIELTQAELQVLIFALRLDLETVRRIVGPKDIGASEWNELELMESVMSKLCGHLALKVYN